MHPSSHINPILSIVPPLPSFARMSRSSRIAVADLVAWSGGELRGGDGNHAHPTHVHGVIHDSRDVTPGCLFAAVSGERFDGHDFVPAAFEAGAALALVERPVDGPCVVVPDVRRALLDLARGYRATFDIPVVGITGSVGKTTVKELLADLLATLGQTARNPGNWNNDLGLPLSLLNMPPETRFAVMELGMNHPGEIAPLCEVLRPTHAIVTEIGAAHIEAFEDVEGIAEEKAALVRALPEEGLQVLDLASEWFDFLADRCPGRAVVIDSEADPLPAPLALPGEHMRRNALKAVAMARALGVQDAAVAAVLRNFRPPGMRWRVEERGGLRFINDAYNANPMSVRAALDAFAGMEVAGAKWVVLGGMHELGEHGERAHAEIGCHAKDGPWRLVSVGAMARPIAVAGDGIPVGSCEDAAWLLREHAAPGDTVLVKASRGERLERVLDHYEGTKP